MGFLSIFSSCDHEWKFYKTKYIGLFKGTSQNWHKCTKCGKTAVCGSYEDTYCSSALDSWGDYRCPDCGVNHGRRKNGT